MTKFLNKAVKLSTNKHTVKNMKTSLKTPYTNRPCNGVCAHIRAVKKANRTLKSTH